MAGSGPRGKLKILLGYAAGVGKTFQMLNEACELNNKGVDVAVGYFEPHGRQDTMAKCQGLEIIPRHKIEYRSAAFEEMDTDAILSRHPEVCVVDELAHTNVPGSARTKRWEDVHVLLENGINVLTNMNVQHLESLNDQVWQFTGVRVRETIPDWVVEQADEVVMVDLPPQALLNRLRRGAIYPSEKAKRATQNFFKESTLVALRELALRQTAHEVDIRQWAEEERGASHSGSAGRDVDMRPERARAPERILLYLTGDPSSAALIRRGRRVADYLQADCFAVCVWTDADMRSMPAHQRHAVERHLNFARNLHIETHLLQGRDVAKTLVEFAHLNAITQIFLARTKQNRPFGRNLVLQVVRLASDMQVTIVADRRRT